ncbi:hypothetical protein A2V82_16810 [candidate division KSB1 bacterium RBG_16_48_16]|nr:MAG: hypothetical protein A2V82_16810 [candidate division KSB1 bacterium RBG_16_48_16]
MNIGPTERIIILLLLGVPIFYLLTLRKALSRCSVECRTMSPNSVWWDLLPLYNLYWQFVIVKNIAESLSNEFRKRNIAVESKPGFGVGLAMCILTLLAIVPPIRAIAGTGAFIFWIVYWATIAVFSAKLVNRQVKKLFNQGVELYEQKQFLEAEKVLQKALESMPSSEDIMYNLALVYLEEKKYDLARKLVNQIKTIDCREIIDSIRTEEEKIAQN